MMRRWRGGDDSGMKVPVEHPQRSHQGSMKAAPGLSARDPSGAISFESLGRPLPIWSAGATDRICGACFDADAVEVLHQAVPRTASRSRRRKPRCSPPRPRPQRQIVAETASSTGSKLGPPEAGRPIPVRDSLAELGIDDADEDDLYGQRTARPRPPSRPVSPSATSPRVLYDDLDLLRCCPLAGDASTRGRSSAASCVSGSCCATATGSRGRGVRRQHRRSQDPHGADRPSCAFG